MDVNVQANKNIAFRDVDPLEALPWPLGIGSEDKVVAPSASSLCL